jgi:hypothetical protein
MGVPDAWIEDNFKFTAYNRRRFVAMHVLSDCVLFSCCSSFMHLTQMVASSSKLCHLKDKSIV